MERKYRQINVKKTAEFKKFEEICKKYNLKKASILQIFFKEFSKNPAKFLNFE